MNYFKDTETIEVVEDHKWGCAKVMFHQPQIVFTHVEIYAGYGMPRHLHEDVDQFSYIVSGRGEVVVGDEHIAVKTGMVYRAPVARGREATEARTYEIKRSYA